MDSLLPVRDAADRELLVALPDNDAATARSSSPSASSPTTKMAASATSVATYREFPPPAPLARHLACLWVHTADDRAHDHRVVPDACADIIAPDGRAPIVVGPAASTHVVTLPPRAVLVGARFRPGAASSLLKTSTHELLDLTVPLADLWTADEADHLRERVSTSSSISAALHALESLLLDRLPDARPHDPLVETAVRWLARHPGRPVRDLADTLDLGGRQLLRRFAATVGLGPKLLQRVLRFQRLLALARPGRASLAELAAAAGYVDQPHMTRDVRELAGVTPTALLATPYSPAAMAEFLRTCDA